MLARPYVSVGRTTNESSLTDRISFLLGDDDDRDNDGSLVSACVRVVADNFDAYPAELDALPPATARRVVSRLPVLTDPRASVPHVHDENYWKRVCVERFGTGRCCIEENGLSWKRLFCERCAQELLETFDADKDDFESLLRTLSSFQDYIFTLKFEQLPSTVKLDKVCEVLPNLIRLDARCGAVSDPKRMEYDSRTYGLKLTNAANLGNAVGNMRCLTSLVLDNNRIDDDVLRTLVDSMTDGPSSATVVLLDVSHNRITTNGLRALANKLLGNDSVLTDLNVADNRIHAEGGRCLGRLLRSNVSLKRLNARLNRLEDAGGRMLLDGLRDNDVLTALNLSSNSLGRESAAALASVLGDDDSKSALDDVDVSSNAFSKDDSRAITNALKRNENVVSIDMRMNAYALNMEEQEEVERVCRRNELNFLQKEE